MTPARRITETLRRIRREDARRTQDVRRSRVVGRETDGRLRLQYLDGTCVLSGEVGPEGTGDEIAIPRGPLFHRGTTGVATVTAHRETSTLWVERIDPATYDRGQAYTVQIHGRGFTEATVFDFLTPGSELINPDITQVAQRYLSDVLIELDITVAPTAQVFAAARLAYDDPTVIN